MDDIVFDAWGIQKKILKDQHRVIGAFAGKRCINPLSSVVTTRGVKAFADISDKDSVLSFDQKANQFRFSQSGSAFPKTKEIGYRVIHERGEFVSSGLHRILCSDGNYRSVLDIYASLRIYANESNLFCLSPLQTTEELDQLSSPLNARRLSQTPLGCLDRYESVSHQYDLLPQRALELFQALSQQTLDALGLKNLFGQHDQFSLQVGPSDMRLKYNHLDQAFFRFARTHLMDHGAFRASVLCQHLRDERTYERSHRLFQVFSQLLRSFYASYKEQESSLLSPGLKDVLTYKSPILAIEVESRPTWFWDVEIPGDNNYYAEGAIHHNSGKTECGAIKSILLQENKINYNPKSIDPFVGAIIAPTFQMLTRLSLKKFMLYAKPFIANFNKSTYEIEWHDGSIIYGLSADRPERIEGLKLHWGWLDEVFQMSEQLFLELKARTSDTQGNIIATGSLGVQFINPKQHWAYKYFKEKPDANTSCYEWATKDNPHFPQDELESLRNQLDPVTFRAMFEIDWDTIPKNAVYHLFSNDNVIESYPYNQAWPTYVSIDWGFAHDMAVGFFQVNPLTGDVFLFDEIIQNKLTLEQLWEKLKPRVQNYNIHAWFCDIAGNQEREATGQSNVKWFKERGVYLKHTRDSIANGISIVRSYVCNTAGLRRFYIASSCKKSIDGLKQYRYPEKDGVIVNENPIKKDDDAVDMIRYFFMNYELSKRPQTQSTTFKVR